MAGRGKLPSAAPWFAQQPVYVMKICSRLYHWPSQHRRRPCHPPRFTKRTAWSRKSAKHAARVEFELMVFAWPEPPSVMSAEKSAGVRDGILQAFAFDTTETPPEVTFLKGRRLRSALPITSARHRACFVSFWFQRPNGPRPWPSQQTCRAP
jgi:hypothetical protein